MDNIQPIILAAVERASQWVRHDLLSTDAAIRIRAEEAMAAMITQALRDARDQATDGFGLVAASSSATRSAQI